MSSAPNMLPGSGAGTRGGLPEEKNVAQLVKENTNVYARKFQALLDRSTPHTMERWLFTLGLFLLFVLRVVISQGVSLVLAGAHDPSHINKALPLTSVTVVHRLLRPGYLHSEPVPRVPAASIRPVNSRGPGCRRGRRRRAGSTGRRWA